MAQARKRATTTTPTEPEAIPTTEEIGAAIDAWRATHEVYAAALADEARARTALVAVLRRAGLKGLMI